MKCIVCQGEVVGSRTTCSVKCRVAKSRMQIKPLEKVTEKKFEGKKNNTDKCEYMGKQLCLKADRERPCKALHDFWICGKHGEHIDKYCESMCND